jgi:hypothetical protein
LAISLSYTTPNKKPNKPSVAAARGFLTPQRRGGRATESGLESRLLESRPTAKKQDWLLKCLRVGRALLLAAYSSARLCWNRSPWLSDDSGGSADPLLVRVTRHTAMKKLRIVILRFGTARQKRPLNAQIQNPSNPFGIVPLSNFVPRGFGFVHHSIALLYHEVPNP